MSVKQHDSLDESANRYKSEVCDAIMCNNPAFDFVRSQLSGGHFFSNPCESDPEEVVQLKDPSIYQ